MSDQRLSFRRYLVRPAVLAIVLTLWAALSIVTWAMYQQFRSLLIEQGVQIGEQFAQRGATLMLVEDPTLTRQTLDVFRNFPGVRYLAVLDRDFNVRIEEGLKRFRPGELSEPVPSARLNNKERWQFIAPMRTIKEVVNKSVENSLSGSLTFNIMQPVSLGQIAAPLARPLW